MRSALKNLSLLIALVGVVYLIANYGGSVKNRIFDTFNIPGSSVKGASTQKAEEVSKTLKEDLGEQFEIVKEQALKFSLGDAFTTVSRLQKIPQDFQSIKEYTQEQINHVIKSRQK